MRPGSIGMTISFRGWFNLAVAANARTASTSIISEQDASAALTRGGCFAVDRFDRLSPVPIEELGGLEKDRRNLGDARHERHSIR